ncbi:hypothetical protein TRAPUB_4308 [Trametes pubescens]|uniref:Uncharacterized protein n=1 Tax=Trametes pubescens TaxID=154538 RepID=A0A1M2W7R6_TRAPU|nr:hypothetical protein TRAPUB_4308 [Trametes pubescens]
MPPGPRFLLEHLHYIVVPPSFPFLAVFLSRRFFDVSVPTWALVPLVVLSIPLSFFVYVVWRKFSWSRSAAAHGAKLPPETKRRDAQTTDSEKRYPRASYCKNSPEGHKLTRRGRSL